MKEKEYCERENYIYIYTDLNQGFSKLIQRKDHITEFLNLFSSIDKQLINELLTARETDHSN